MINKIILGTVQFGLNYGVNNTEGKPSVEQVIYILNVALEQGITTLDTADAYGNASEIIGKYHLIRPNTFSINTKFTKSNISIHQQFEIALKKLQVNKLNTYFFHSFNDFVHYPEILNELRDLKRENLINKIGLSIYNNNEFKIAIECKEIDVIQLPFNLLDNYSQRGELLKEAKANGKEIQVRSVYLQGLFFMPLTKLPPILRALSPYLEKINAIANELQISMEQLALQYALSQTEIDNVLIGVDNIEQLNRNLAFSNNILSMPVLQTINKIIVKETNLLYPKNWN